VRAMF